ncbi:MAG: hypothetical protein ACFFGZ_08305 [Candidatus Thorarchaeota archaeon]
MTLAGPGTDKTAVLEAVLEKVSSHLLSSLVSRWTKASYVIPEDSDSQKKLQMTMEAMGSLSKGKLQYFRKLEKFLTLDSPWSPFLISNKCEINKIGLLRRFGTSQFFPNPKASVTGKLHVFEIEEGIFLIIAEFSSRSSLLRTFRRFVIAPEIEMLIAEHDELARKLLVHVIQPTFGIEIQNLAINSMALRDIADEWGQISGLNCLVTTETAGVEGLETVGISGENVLSGADELKSAKNMASSLKSIGPWIGIETDSFSVNIYEGMRFKQFVLEDLRRLKEVLEVEED